MVEEVSGLEEPPKEERVKSADISKPVKNSKTEGVEDKEDWIMFMENDIQKFPYRKSEVWSPGIDPRMQCSFCDLTGEHFSDSCSVYTAAYVTISSRGKDYAISVSITARVLVNAERR
ncbi:unnamed protein product [Heligmosomoides polygyrus]|uniref:Zinc finger, CCHC-type n=1 Tax=Heligmosomoides polygyrus TaxID=6339 RepID=A0A183GI09_HELPZ|nr:unnamed protein product [Heligmosomoides polygyrus]